MHATGHDWVAKVSHAYTEIHLGKECTESCFIGGKICGYLNFPFLHWQFSFPVASLENTTMVMPQDSLLSPSLLLHIQKLTAGHIWEGTSLSGYALRLRKKFFFGTVLTIFKVRFHLRGAAAGRSPQGGADFWVTVFSCCVFPLRRFGGGAEAGVRGGSAGMGPGAIFPLRPAVWTQIVSSLLKHQSHGIDIKNTPIALKLDRRIYCCAADQPVKIQTDWRTTSISRFRDFTKSYDETS